VELLRRLLGPLGVEIRQPWLTEADCGFLEFVLLSVLERVQQEAHFPFHFSLKSGRPEKKRSAESLGMAAPFTLTLPGASGVFRLFVPMDLVASVQQRVPSLARNCLPASIRWSFPLSLGQVELTQKELQSLETSDVVLFNEVAELLFPATGKRGWKGLLERAEVSRFRVHQYLRGAARWSQKANPKRRPQPNPRTGGPTSANCPCFFMSSWANRAEPGRGEWFDPRLHPRTGDTEGEPVDLAVNGKRVGKGELVNVEGKWA